MIKNHSPEQESDFFYFKVTLKSMISPLIALISY